MLGLSHSHWKTWGGSGGRSCLTPASWSDGREEFHQPFLTSIPCAHSSSRKLCCVTGKAEITHRCTGGKRTGCSSVSERGKWNMVFEFTLHRSVSVLNNSKIQQVAWILLRPAQHEKQTERITNAASKTGVAEQKGIELAAPRAADEF